MRSKKRERGSNDFFSDIKKAQVTVFIIIAILIIFLVVIIFFNKTKIISIFGDKESPIEQINNCIKKSSVEGMKIISLQGGSLDPKNYYLYEGNKVEYTCYTGENYKPCIMQKPILKQYIQKELEKYLSPKINECLINVKNNLEKDNYQVDYKDPKINVEIVPNNIIITTDLDLNVNKDTNRFYKNVDIKISNNLYDLLMIASSINNFETRYGDSETMSFMMYYPNLKVEKKLRSEGTKIYILTNRDTKNKFMFATRSYAIPPGVVGI